MSLLSISVKQWRNKVMWKALIKLVEKWACCHEWKLHRKVSTYEADEDKRPVKVVETLICTKCGKIKKVRL